MHRSSMDANENFHFSVQTEFFEQNILRAKSNFCGIIICVSLKYNRFYFYLTIWILLSFMKAIVVIDWTEMNWSFRNELSNENLTLSSISTRILMYNGTSPKLIRLISVPTTSLEENAHICKHWYRYLIKLQFIYSKYAKT